MPALPSIPDPESAASGWRGALTLRLEQRGEATVVAGRRHQGPLQIQRAFYPEGSRCCHLYLLHPPGGLVAGDELHLDVSLGAGSQAVLTTPAATKIYRSISGRIARQEQHFQLEAGADLEWLPQESIIFDGAEARLTTSIDLEGDARFVGWEVVCLGRAAAEAPFRSGRCGQRIRLQRDGRPLIVDRTQISAGDELALAAFGLRGESVLGTFLASPVPAGALEIAREIATSLPAGDLATATALPDVLVCRYLGPSAARARSHFVKLWTALRQPLLGRAPCPPRIWMT